MNLYDSCFLCLDIGDFSVRAMAHRVRGGRIIRSGLKIVETSDTSFAMRSALDELESQLGTRFDSAFITGNFGEMNFCPIVKTTKWDTPHKITNMYIQNQNSEIIPYEDFYPIHVFPLRYDTNHVSNLLTPIGKTDTGLTSVFGAIFAEKNKTAKILDILRNTHIQAKTFFDPSYLLSLNFRQPHENALFINFGACFTSISVWTDRGPVFFEKIHFGQNEITKEIARKLNIKYSESARIKHAISTLRSDEMYRFTPADSNYDFSRGDISDIFIPQITDLVTEIYNLSGDAVSKYNVKRIFISGGGANIKHINEFISDTFDKLPVQNLGSD